MNLRGPDAKGLTTVRKRLPWAKKVGRLVPGQLIALTGVVALAMGTIGAWPAPASADTPNFLLGAPLMTRQVNQGGSTSYYVAIFPSGGFGGAVSLSVRGLPAGASGSFSPNPASPPSTPGVASTLTVTTSASTPGGIYRLTVTGSSGSLSRSTELTLLVVAPAFSLFPSPVSRSVAPGGSTSYTVSVNRVGGFSGAVSLSVSGLPAGASGSFDPNPNPASSASSTLTVATSSSTPAGSHTLTITGTSGSLSHSTTVTLIVDGNANFLLGAPLMTRQVNQGGSTSYYVAIFPSGGFGGAVSLSVRGLPAGASGSFSPNPASPPSTPGVASTLTVTTSASTPGGIYRLTVTGSSGSLSRSTELTLLVVAPAFSLFPSPVSRSVAPGGSTSYTVSVNRVGGFSGAVSLSVSGLPSGASGFHAAGQPPTLIVLTDPSTPTGSYTLTIKGTGGGLSHSTAVTLEVARPDFTLDGSPASQTVFRGASTSYAVSVKALRGFAGYVSLSVSGIPAGATGSFNHNPIYTSSTLTVSASASTPAGSHTLTITGTSGSLSHLTTITLNVAVAADFSLSPSPVSQSVAPGGSTSYTVSVGRMGGFGDPVSLSVSGLPAGASGSLNPNPVTVSSSSASTLTVRTSASTPAGSHTLTITGTSGSLSHSTTVTLVVRAAAVPDFSLSPSFPSQTLAAGATTSYTISITRAGGFSGAVSLSVSGLPAGASGSFFPNPATSGSSSLTVSTSSSTLTGTYTLALTGTGGSLTRSATLTLIVGAPTSPDFSLSLSPASRTVAPGGTGGYELLIHSIAGFSYTSQSWAVSGLPSGISSLVYVPLPGEGPPFVNVTPSTTTPKGSYTFTVTATLWGWGSSGSRTHSTTGTLVVVEPDFSLSLSPASRTVAPGGTGGYELLIHSIAGFSYTSQSWAVSGLPSGISSLVYVPLPGEGPPFVNVTPSTTTPKGSYTFTVTATLWGWGSSGSRTHSTTGTLVVH
jgi:uncharacterized membrane protein